MLGFAEFSGVNVVEHGDAEEEAAATRVKRDPAAAARATKESGDNMFNGLTVTDADIEGNRRRRGHERAL